jgi:carboxymethylenebutenolidase
MQLLSDEYDPNRKESKMDIYPNAGHGFLNDTRPEAYRPDAAQDAWKRTLAWFRKHPV